MAEPPDHSRPRLGSPDNRMPDVTGAAVSLTVCARRSVLNLRCRSQDSGIVAAISDALRCPLPLEPNRCTGNDSRAVIWLGPDEWLVVAASGEATEIETRIRSGAVRDPWLSVVDLSHHYAGLMLTGAATRDVLAKGCPLDLHRRSFGSGDCAQTVLAGTRVLLRCVDDEPSIELWVRNSFAHYAVAWLADAMAEFVDLGAAGAFGS